MRNALSDKRIFSHDTNTLIRWVVYSTSQSRCWLKCCSGLYSSEISPELEVTADISIGIRRDIIRIQITDSRFVAIIPITAREQENTAHLLCILTVIIHHFSSSLFFLSHRIIIVHFSNCSIKW